MSLPVLLTPDQVASWLGKTRKAVYHMVDRGTIPAECTVRIGGTLRFDEKSLKHWIAEKRASSGSA